MRVFLAAGAIALMVLAARTYQPPSVPSLDDMHDVTVTDPRLTEHCEGSAINGGSRTCRWRLRLDDGTHLSWPWPDSQGPVKAVDRYLRQHGPLSVRFSDGTAFRIALGDGQVYVRYADAAGWERTRQRLWVWFGAAVAGLAAARVGFEVWRLRSPVTARTWDGSALALTGACLVGGLYLVGAGGDRIWWAVIALAAFSGVAQGLGVLLDLGVPPHNRTPRRTTP